MAIKRNIEGPVHSRCAKIDQSRKTLRQIERVLDWASEHTHGRRQWQMVEIEKRRLAVATMELDEAAACGEGPIQMAAAAGWRDRLVEQFGWREPEPDPPSTHPLAAAAGRVLRVVSGGLSMHDRYIRHRDMQGKAKSSAPSAGVANDPGYEDRINLIVEGQGALRALPVEILRAAVEGLKLLSRPWRREP